MSLLTHGDLTDADYFERELEKAIEGIPNCSVDLVKGRPGWIEVDIEEQSPLYFNDLIEVQDWATGYWRDRESE